MAHRIEAGFFPRFQKEFSARPTVEANAQPIILECSEHFCKSRLEPMVMIIIGVVVSSTAFGTVIHQIRRISNDKIEGIRRDLPENFDTIAENNALKECLHWI